MNKPKYLFTFATPFEKPGDDLISLNKYGETLITGIGKLNSALTLMKHLNHHPFDHVINLGIAGTIASDISLLEILSISQVIEGDHPSLKKSNSFPKIPLTSSFSIPQLKSVKLVTQDHPVLTEEEKLFWRTHSVDLCDMEAFALAKVSMLHKIPFSSFKVTTDFASNGAKEEIKRNIQSAKELLAQFLIENF